jgi:hypothetical protein
MRALLFIKKVVTRRNISALLVLIIKFLVSITILMVALAHIFSLIEVDIFVLVLFGFVVIIWLAPALPKFFKAFEFPGGWKIEFQDLRQIAPEKQTDQKELLIFDLDPNIAVVALRIEIEKRLRRLALSTDHRPRSLRQTMDELRRSEILSPSEYSVLNELVVLGNSAAHGADVTESAVHWARDTGPRILAALDKKIADIEGDENDHQ